MKRRRIDSSQVKQILIGLITNKKFLAAMGPITDPALFDTRYAIQIAEWCIDYYKKHRGAPGKDIEAMYQAWAEKDNTDEGDADAVNDFLGELSGKYEKIGASLNLPYLMSTAADYLTLKNVERLENTLADARIHGRTSEALDAVAAFRHVDVGGKDGFNPLKSKSAWKRAFADPMEPLLDYGGDAGKFLNSAFTRESLIGIQAPEKRGKTFWLMEFKHRFIRAGKKVAMFQAGDLSERQYMLRYATRLTQVPMNEWQRREGVLIPRKLSVVQGPDDQPTPEVEYYPQAPYPYAIGPNIVWTKARELMSKRKIPNADTRMMLSCHATGTLNVRKIGTILDRWEQELGFVPDGILIDYVDILEPEYQNKDFRQQVNETWMALSRLRHERNACVVAPTQASKESYGARTQMAKHVTEDKRKNAHVTGMLGLNQTEEEKKQGVQRLNWSIRREAPFHPSDCLWTATCFALAMPMVKSTLYRP